MYWEFILYILLIENTLTRINENIFSLDAIEVVVRITQDDLALFQQFNGVSMNDLKSELLGNEIECYFQKLAAEEHKIIVPVRNGQLELVVRPHISETYQVILNKSLKSRFRPERQFPDKDFLREIILIRIIDINERARATDEFTDLFSRIEDLEIATAIDVKAQQELWQLWIEAQSAIIANLQQPFQVKLNYDLREKRNDNKEIIGYTLKFELSNEIVPEYRQLEAKLLELGIDEKFDSDGSILLTRAQVKILDTVIQREFADSIERSPTLGAIIVIQPLKLIHKIGREIGLQAFQDNNTHQLTLLGLVSDFGNQLVRKYGFEFKSYQADFEIINHGNILENEEINSLFKLKFTRPLVGVNSDHNYVLPFPEGNTISVRTSSLKSVKLVQEPIEVSLRDEYFKLQLFYRSLIRIYGKENIIVRGKTIYEALDTPDSGLKKEDFSDEFWTNLKRTLYLNNLEETLNMASRSLFIEFTTEEELNAQLTVIRGIDQLSIVYGPEKDDFRFKVKTSVIKKKSAKEKFAEKLKLLRGAEFVVEVPLEGRRDPELVYIGKLNSRESDLKQISLNIPSIFRDDKKMAKEALKFLNQEDRPVIKSIRANLKGDAAKISWLLRAVSKISEPSNVPNGKSVNEKLGEFIFDTHKATPIYNTEKVTENSEYYRDMRNNELLKLNESQRKAVLAAIHCNDLALLQGPPGTGKTTVIAEIIWQIIRKDMRHKILLTSETNLAVDNALDRLLNLKGVDPRLGRNTTLIKPLRFGKMKKMDEEGAKYSYDRIMKWADESYEASLAPEPDALDEQDDDWDENAEKNSFENNAVQDWMNRIASRARYNDPRFANALKDWALDLSFPTSQVRQLFKDNYIKYANVVGSTCSSSGSPQFMWDIAKVFDGENIPERKRLNKILLMSPFAKDVKGKLEKYSIPREILNEFEGYLSNYQREYEILRSYFRTEGTIENERGSRLFLQLQTVDRRPIKSEQDSKNLVSFRNLLDFSIKNLAPYTEPKTEFDTVIMDEASKATPPELLLPLCFGKRCVVIGDHRQLPPMLNEKDLKEVLLESGAQKLADEIDKEFTETSQFERMILNPKVSPTIISRCNIQYRMHPDINEVIKQFYLDEGGLEPAPELLENADSPDLNDVFSRYHGIHIPGLLDPNVHTLWVNVQTPELREAGDTSVTNPGEVKAIRKLLEMIKSTDGFNGFIRHWDFIKDEFKRKQEKEIGVISFYGAQKRMLKRSLAGIGIPLKINTVDRFQGMEKNIVIVSTVRSNKQTVFGGGIKPNSDSGFAKSPQRLNVALSRGRRLLIVVGNKDFFSEVKDRQGKLLYKNAINAIAQKGRIIDFESLINKPE